MTKRRQQRGTEFQNRTSRSFFCGGLQTHPPPFSPGGRVQARGDQRRDRPAGRSPFHDRVVIDVARLIHRHASGRGEPRGDQRGELTDRNVSRSGLRDGEDQPGHGKAANARRPRIGVEGENHALAARSALIGRAQMEPGVVRRRGPSVGRGRHRQHHAVRPCRRALHEMGGPKRGGLGLEPRGTAPNAQENQDRAQSTERRTGLKSGDRPRAARAARPGGWPVRERMYFQGLTVVLLSFQFVCSSDAPTGHSRLSTRRISKNPSFFRREPPCSPIHVK